MQGRNAHAYRSRCTRLRSAIRCNPIPTFGGCRHSERNYVDGIGGSAVVQDVRNPLLYGLTFSSARTCDQTNLWRGILSGQVLLMLCRCLLRNSDWHRGVSCRRVYHTDVNVTVSPTSWSVELVSRCPKLVLGKRGLPDEDFFKHARYFAGFLFMGAA